MSLSEPSQPSHQATPFSLNIQSSHRYLSTNFDEQAFYLLVNITPSSSLPLLRLPLNLSLVLDRSTSMKGTRLHQVKQGVKKIIDQLEPQDALSVVIFGDKSQILVPSRRNIDKVEVKQKINTIQAGGGTEMLQGLTAGLEQLQFNRTRQSINHLIFLTDGQTYGDEADCLAKSQWAGHHQINFTTMGIGDDWNESLLDSMAHNSGGNSIYIDVPQKIADVFQSTMQTLSSVVARELSLDIDLSPGVTLSEAFQMTPYITRLNTETPKMLLGPLAVKHGKILLMEFRVKTALSQQQEYLVKFMVDGDIPNQSEPNNQLSMKVKAPFSENIAKHTIPSTIVTALGKLAIFKLQEKALFDLEQGEVVMATRRLETMATRLLNIGEADLARSALSEAGRLAHTGNLSAEGRKKIRYGTRSLSLLSQEVGHD